MTLLIYFEKKNVIDKNFNKETFYQRVLQAGFKAIDLLAYDSWNVLKVTGSKEALDLLKIDLKHFYSVQPNTIFEL